MDIQQPAIGSKELSKKNTWFIARGGGLAISIKRATGEDLSELERVE